MYSHGKYVFTTEAHPLPVSLGVHNDSLVHMPSFGAGFSARRVALTVDQNAQQSSSAAATIPQAVQDGEDNLAASHSSAPNVGLTTVDDVNVASLRIHWLAALGNIRRGIRDTRSDVRVFDEINPVKRLDPGYLLSELTHRAYAEEERFLIGSLSPGPEEAELVAVEAISPDYEQPTASSAAAAGVVLIGSCALPTSAVR